MAARLIAETTFLIDLEREAHRGRGGPAQEYLRGHPESLLFVTPTILGEMACGAALPTREAWEEFARPFPVLQIGPEAAWEYGQLFRYLQGNGRLIGANDLWIAAVALAHGVGVLTRNAAHYRRVPRLEVHTYA